MGDVMTFTTRSGAVYTVKDGRISREEGRSPIFGTPADFTVAMMPFEWVIEPVVGASAVYVLTERRDLGPIRTAGVVSIGMGSTAEAA